GEQQLCGSNLRRRKVRKPGGDVQDHHADRDGGGDRNGRVDADERTRDAVDVVDITTSIRFDEMAHDAIAVAEVDQLEVRGHGGHEHPKPVMRLAEVADRVGDQYRTETDVQGQNDVF